MRRAGFAVGTLMQQSSLPASAVLGLVLFHDHLSGRGWIGVRLDRSLDWAEIAELCQDAYRAIAPPAWQPVDG